MSDHVFDQLQCWALRNLPARIDAHSAAKLLGMAEHDIPVLVTGRLLKPLGSPAQNATKWFSAIEVMQLAADREWLDKATKRIGDHWKRKRLRSKTTANDRELELTR